MSERLFIDQLLGLNLNAPIKVGLKFADVDIIEVRAASPEEIAHGHAHGPGGHH